MTLSATRAGLKDSLVKKLCHEEKLWLWTSPVYGRSYWLCEMFFKARLEFIVGSYGSVSESSDCSLENGSFMRTISQQTSGPSGDSSGDHETVPDGIPMDNILNAIAAAVSKCSHATTILYPRFEESMSFEIVSEGFENLSGYSRRELEGRNLRCLTHGCEECFEDIIGRNSSERTGEMSVTALTFRRKTGEMCACEVLYRGLSLGFDPDTGQKLWVLIAIYQEVDDDIPGAARTTMTSLAEDLRSIISNTLGTLQNMMSVSSACATPSGLWQLLPSCPWHPPSVAARSNTAPLVGEHRHEYQNACAQTHANLPSLVQALGVG
mmetsp:Transcript_20129/g.35725  ORF Transcript_20129/g.35725 Transcript_20129/m.35725 type:complete len:323 (+) Transcript_20129:249-1217(+)|eukprot:CAMPEP_0197661646 /NCGR_PEP_ID=MMETSP1338-20131121/51574_1 /TAXON_ID=43686 ORGANISM="Pelagodinium beii, Strain RCC1491" /NCGR_SAMPLE_ID=MMETSP1338 /ASSEMBLY_ACC=CAM_ASM_000754 /LENGTH=322 /DNA_ID=CAMNT_0043239229 /DNA_START=150 /DNA_END=1118 /DNA_ORIENTATION=+